MKRIIKEYGIRWTTKGLIAIDSYTTCGRETVSERGYLRRY